MAYHPWQEMDFAEILNNNTVKKYIMDDHAADSSLDVIFLVDM